MDGSEKNPSMPKSVSRVFGTFSITIARRQQVDSLREVELFDEYGRPQTTRPLSEGSYDAWVVLVHTLELSGETLEVPWIIVYEPKRTRWIGKAFAAWGKEERAQWERQHGNGAAFNSET